MKKSIASELLLSIFCPYLSSKSCFFISFRFYFRFSFRFICIFVNPFKITFAKVYHFDIRCNCNDLLLIFINIMDTKSIAERLTEYFNGKGISQVGIAEKLGVTRAYINSLFAGRRPFGKKQAEKWEEIFGISKSWLLTGEGEMLVDNGGFVEVPDEDVINLNPKPYEKVTLVPLINIDSVGGMSHTNDIDWRSQYTVRKIPFTDARPDDVAIYQSGDSMSPGIPAGSILHIRQVHDWQEYFGYGNTFVLWLKDDRRITKQVLKFREDPKNFVTCHSFNPSYQDEELPKKFIRQVWKVITVLSDKGW